MNKYDRESKKVALIIDLAIEAIKSELSENLADQDKSSLISFYSKYKNKALNPEDQYRNIKSLAYIENDILAYFREGTGKPIEEFWQKLKQHHINVNRYPSLIKNVLKRGIKNDIEYQTLVDNFLSYTEQKLISEENLEKIDRMISEFNGDE